MVVFIKVMCLNGSAFPDKPDSLSDSKATKTGSRRSLAGSVDIGYGSIMPDFSRISKATGGGTGQGG